MPLNQPEQGMQPEQNYQQPEFQSTPELFPQVSMQEPVIEDEAPIEYQKEAYTHQIPVPPQNMRTTKSQLVYIVILVCLGIVVIGAPILNGLINPYSFPYFIYVWELVVLVAGTIFFKRQATSRNNFLLHTHALWFISCNFIIFLSLMYHHYTYYSLFPLCSWGILFGIHVMLAYKGRKYWSWINLHALIFVNVSIMYCLMIWLIYYYQRPGIKYQVILWMIPIALWGCLFVVHLLASRGVLVCCKRKASESKATIDQPTNTQPQYPNQF
jgi:hypothetical protein